MCQRDTELGVGIGDRWILQHHAKFGDRTVQTYVEPAQIQTGEISLLTLESE